MGASTSRTFIRLDPTWPTASSPRDCPAPASCFSTFAPPASAWWWPAPAAWPRWAATRSRPRPTSTRCWGGQASSSVRPESSTGSTSRTAKPDNGRRVMALALVLVSCALVVSLWFQLFGAKSAASSSVSSLAQSGSERLRALEADVERKRRDADEVKATCNELRAELKQAKRKLHEQRETGKGEQDLLRARTDVERSASQQLEVVRGELAHALTELSKLRSDAETSRSRARTAAPPVPAPHTAPAALPPPPPPPSLTAAPAAEAERSARRFRE